MGNCQAIKNELNKRREQEGNGFKITMKADDRPLYIWYLDEGYGISFDKDKKGSKQFTNMNELVTYLNNYGKKEDVETKMITEDGFNIELKPENALSLEKISKLDVIDIWQPKYKTHSVLIATYKVKPGINYVAFSKANHLANMVYKVDSKVIKQSPITTNGKIEVYDVPFDRLTRVF